VATQGVADGDIVLLTRKAKKARMSIQDIPRDIKPEDLIALVEQHPHILTQLQSADPGLGAKVAAKDCAALRMFMMMRTMSQHKAGYEAKQERERIFSDPDNPEHQAKIEEAIRQQNIDSQMEVAMEEIPESFARVIMLYVDIEINGMGIKAFVDSGAQSTIMSVRCAERCNLMRYVDRRYAGEARGVGSAKIAGRIHIVQMKIGTTFIPISLTVLESNDVDFLLGLDNLKRHHCCIDLAKNALRVGGEGGEEVQFLSEKDLPTMARGTLPDELLAESDSKTG
jgi:DNA damage-inducible protein 1